MDIAKKYGLDYTAVLHYADVMYGKHDSIWQCNALDHINAKLPRTADTMAFADDVAKHMRKHQGN